TAWIIGLFVSGLILLYGNRVEIFAWSFGAIISPLSAVYYPIEILPPAVQIISRLLPTTYVFQGLRQLINSGTVNYYEIGFSFLLAVIYLSVTLVFITWCFQRLLERGLV